MSQGKLPISRLPGRFPVQDREARLNLACYPCRTKKVKCDHLRPTCSRCLDDGTQCEYADGRRNRIKELEEELDLIRGQYDRLLQQTQPAASGSTIHDLLPEFNSGHLRLAANAGSSSSTELGMLVDLPTSHASFYMSGQGPVHLADLNITALQFVYDTLRNADMSDLGPIHDAVRAAATPEDAMKVLTGNVATEHSPVTTEKSDTQTISGLVSLGNLLPEPLFKLSAKPWTQITDDDNLVSTLISFFFAWDNPDSWVDQDMFIKSMSSGIPGFCSPLLVNAILAQACFYAYAPDRPWDRSTEWKAGKLFFSEATRLLAEDKKTPSLAACQALLVMNSTINAMGNDKLGQSYYKLGLDMALSLGLDQPLANFSRLNPELTDSRMKKEACARLAWGLFSWNTLTAHIMREMPIWKDPPKMSYPPTAKELDLENLYWTPYPFKSPSIKQNAISLARAKAALHVIVNEMTIFIMQTDSVVEFSEYAEEAFTFYARLETWRRELPAWLELTENWTPLNVLVHYYFYVTSLCNNYWLAQQYAGIEEHIATVQFDFKEVNKIAKIGLRDTIETYRSRHGWKSGAPLLAHFLCVGALNALEELETKDGAWLNSFDTCVSGLWYLSLSWAICRPTLRLIQRALEKSNIAAELVPATAQHLLNTFGSKMWKSEYSTALQSIYPVFWRVSELPDDGKPADLAYRGLKDLLRTLEETHLAT